MYGITKGNVKGERKLGWSLLNQSMSEDMEASYPDSAYVNILEKGVQRNQRRWRTGQVKEVGIHVLRGHPLPKHLGQVSGNHWGIASWQGTHLMILSSNGLSMPVSWSVCPKSLGGPKSVPWSSVHFCHNFLRLPQRLCPGKY